MSDHWLRSARELPRELPAVARFLRDAVGATTASDRLGLLARFYEISGRVPCVHKQSEILPIVRAILGFDPAVRGCVVEAGTWKGASAAKLSLACAHVERRLFVFDSFAGLPDNAEWMDAAAIVGSDREGPERFDPGGYRGTRAEVERTLTRFGARDTCELVEGWFEDTLPHFREPVCVAFLDVDLAASTRTCLAALHPLLSEGGVIFSHDGHLPLVREVFESDERFAYDGIGAGRLVRLEKRARS